MRRRRVFVRAVPGPDGVGSVVTVGGLTRTDASGGFEDEFANLAVDIADVSSPKRRHRPRAVIAIFADCWACGIGRPPEA